MELFAYLEREKGICLNPQQQEAVLAPERNILLLAVPGSGKTTVLVARMAHLLLNRGADSRRMLTLTFSRETARDMGSRFATLFGELCPVLPRFSTIHSFCLSVLRFYAEALNRPMLQLVGKSQKTQILREIYRKQNEEFLNEDNLEILERLIGYVKNMMLTREQIGQENFEISGFAEIFTAYEEWKRAGRWMDYDDMLTLTLEIFRKCPGIRKAVQGRYDYIQVDEAQDTSLVQHCILRILAEKSRVFMVGDEDQSIYAFRGAYPQALLEFPEVYEQPRVIKMEQNYRSNRDIVSAANRFIQQNRNRYPKEMFCENEREGSIQVLPLQDFSGQYTQTLREILACPPDERIAVLYKNNESAVPMMDLLLRQSIPFYVKEHRLTYFSSSLIRDLTCYIRLAADLQDTEAFGQIYYKMGYSRFVNQVVQDQAGKYPDLFACIESLTSVPDFLRKRAAEYRGKLKRLLRLPPAEAIDVICRQMNYQKYIESRMSDGYTRISAYQKLNTAKILAAGLKDPLEFLRRMEGLEQAIQERSGMDPFAQVTLSTLHSSKGMEFDRVILLDCLESVLPSSEAEKESLQGNTALMESEVRLFYVGVTRAKSRLVLFRSDRMNGAPAAESGFIRQLVQGSALPDGNLYGKRVRHSRFGIGRIQKQEGDLLTVYFGNYGVKQLAAELCFREKKLELLDPLEKEKENPHGRIKNR